MSDYSKENKGVFADVAGVGGKVSGAVENVLIDASGEDKRRAQDSAGAQSPGGNIAATTSTVSGAKSSAGTAPAAMTLRDAQQILAEIGYQAGPADGAMVKKTADALRRFQEAERLPVTGKLDQATIGALRKAKRN